MDGIEGVNCKTLEAVHCSWCTGVVTIEVLMLTIEGSSLMRLVVVDSGSSSEPDSIEAIERHIREIGQHDEEVMSGLRLLGRRCIYCKMLGVSNEGVDGRHAYRQCLVAADDELGCSYSDFEGWRVDLQLPDYMHCFWCGLPQTICEVAEFGGSYTYPDVMLPMLFVLHRHRMLVPILQRQLGYRGRTEKDLMEWLMGIAEEIGEDQMQASKVFRCLAMTYWQVEQDDMVR
jgi:hypothetical protein